MVVPGAPGRKRRQSSRNTRGRVRAHNHAANKAVEGRRALAAPVNKRLEPAISIYKDACWSIHVDGLPWRSCQGGDFLFDTEQT